MESWKHAWRVGVAPLLPLRGLEALAVALRDDDRRLLQGATTSPPPLTCVQDWPVEAGCALCYARWQADDYPEHYTVAAAEEWFGQACYAADQLIGDPASYRWFLNWFDETPRDEMRAALLPEVEREIQQRKEGASAHVQTG